MRKIYSLLILALVSKASFAQYRSAHEGFKNDPFATTFAAAKTTAGGGTGNNYDVKYHRLELRINPDTSIGKYIKGKVTTRFETRQSNFTVLKFDFAANLVCDSIYYHGVKLAAIKIVEDVDTLEITLPNIATSGTLDSVSIWYQGVPPNVPGFSNGTGFVRAKHDANTKNYVYTLSEPYSAYTWWPCKSLVVSDKADTLDMIISNPTGFRAAGNGKLISEVTVAGSVISTWRHCYPIAAYQVATAVANYDVYPASPTMVNIGGTMMPLFNYIFPETNTATSRATLDRTALMLTTFSAKFGDYPFKKEKYGHYTFGFGGGMEHNTFSGMNANTYNSSSAWSVIAHELGHQWFGAAVTCGSWRDIWLNESLATYSEIVCAEFAPSVTPGATGLSWSQYVKDIAIDPTTQLRPVYVTDTTSITTIFTPAVYIYERGAMVISMLRILLGDAKFFQAIQNYQADAALAYGPALTNDLKRHFELVSGLNLTTFFNQWIYNTGYPTFYGAKWNNAGKRIQIKLPQVTEYSALSRFDIPVTVRIKGALTANDTTVVIYDNGGILNSVVNGVLTSTGTNAIQYDLSFVPTSATFDSRSQILANGGATGTGLISKDAGVIVLATNILSFTGKKEDNTVKLWWNIDNSFDYTAFEIEKSNDATSFYRIGTIHERDVHARISFSHTDNDLSAGTSYYRIRIIQKDGSVTYTKVISVTTGVESYTITPNPASDHILIKASRSSAFVSNIRIFDGTGRVVTSISKYSFAGNGNLRIGIEKLTAGTYYVEIETEGQAKYSRRIVVIK